MLLAVIGLFATRAYGGPLDPPGPVASTQSSVIYQPGSCAGFPIVLSTPGSYRLGSNITGCAGKDGIQISSSDVTLDLGGFSVIGVPGSWTGIKSVGAIGQLNIANGTIVKWGGAGLDLSSSSGDRVDNVIATNNTTFGIWFASTSALSHSTASANGGGGIYLPSGETDITIRDCNVDYNTGYGIIGGSANGVVVESCSIGNNSNDGISLGSFTKITGNHVHHNSGNGIIVNHSCMIENNSSEWNTGDGISVFAPGNCTIVGNKVSANSGDGIDVETNGGYSLIDSNHASGNGVFGFNIATANPGYPNVVTRNAASANILSNYSVGSNNDVATIVSAGAAANPMSNISN